MARPPASGPDLEPAVLRLQLELKLDRKAAEACVRAGYLRSAEIAASEDAAFHGAVGLPAKERAEVLARARAPGSKAADAGEPPALARDRRPAEAIVKVAKPVVETVSRFAGEVEKTPKPSRGSKPPPPRPGDDDRRRKRTEASEAEAALDEALRGSS